MARLFVFIGILIFVIFFSFFVDADGPGPPVPPVNRTKLNLPANNDALNLTNLSQNYEVQGGNGAVPVLFTYNSGGTRYVAAEATVNFGTDEETINLANLTSEVDVDENKAVFHLDVGEVAQDLFSKGIRAPWSIYIPRDSSHNKLTICNGARGLTEVYRGCSAQANVTSEEEIKLGISNDDYTMTTVTYTLDGVSTTYLKVSSFSGTGVKSFSVAYGGEGTPEVLEEGSTINLDERSSRMYTSRKNIEHYVLVGGEKYLFLVEYVDENNEYATVYVEALDNSYTFSEGESEEFDLDGDGESDVALDVTEINYPEVYLDVRVYSKGEGLEFPDREKVKSGEEKDYSDVGGIWSIFLKMTYGARVQLLSLLIFFTLVVLFFVLVGGKMLSKVWKSV